MVNILNNDVMVSLVKATRNSLTLAENIRLIMSGGKGWSVADEIAGFMTDALYAISGEQLEKDQDFWKHSKTMKLLLGELSDEKVAEVFMQMAEENKLKMPAPILMTKEEREALYGTPEGEWR